MSDSGQQAQKVKYSCKRCEVLQNSYKRHKAIFKHHQNAYYLPFARGGKQNI